MIYVSSFDMFITLIKQLEADDVSYKIIGKCIDAHAGAMVFNEKS